MPKAKWIKRVVAQAKCPVCESEKVEATGTHLMCAGCGSHSDITMIISDSGSISIKIRENLEMFSE